MLIDTHCHLTDKKFTDVRTVIEEAKEAGVAKIVVPAINIEDSKLAAKVAEGEDVYAMAGVHPEEVEGITDVNKMAEELRQILSQTNKMVGIGEIGLDFYWDKEKKTKKKQIEVFAAQMELAVQMNLPVVIHMREAEKEMREVLEKMKVVPRGQFHCFAGSEDFLELILDKGFYVSFAGNITYKTAENLRDMVKKVPLSRLLLETDSPYLSPEPLRGTVNTPANVKIIATAIAAELEVETNILIEQTGKNTLCLLSLES